MHRMYMAGIWQAPEATLHRVDGPSPESGVTVRQGQHHIRGAISALCSLGLGTVWDLVRLDDRKDVMVI
jgi:hypothetical protein